jgi:hypothetical protein|tara:strand:+ start:7088 stop:7285 length:198 start_codon:yes stop_codon:yes gene_type:complete
MSNLNEDKILLQSIASDMQTMAERVMFLEATLGKLIEGLASIGILQLDDENSPDNKEEKSLIVTP